MILLFNIENAKYKDAYTISITLIIYYCQQL